MEKSYKIILLSYNNYYNRKVKYPDDVNSIASYLSETDKYKSFDSINFNTNDGISTSQVVNWNEDFVPDYLLLCSVSETYPLGIIESRWFILNFDKIRGKQYRCELRRDMLVDHYESIVKAPCFIYKGSIGDSDSPLLFNSEGMQFNQIKTSETLLKDRTNTSWIVGYYDKTKKNEMSGTVSALIGQDYVKINTPISQWQYYQYTSNYVSQPTNKTSQIYYKWPTGQSVQTVPAVLWTNSVGSITSVQGLTSTQSTLQINHRPLTENLEAIRNTLNKYTQNFENNFNIFWEERGGSDIELVNDLSSYIGKIIVDSQNKAYRISMIDEQNLSSSEYVTTAQIDAFAAMSSCFVDSHGDPLPNIIVPTLNNSSILINYSFRRFKIKLTELEDFGATWSLTDSDIDTNDAPYNIFCMPYDPHISLYQVDDREQGGREEFYSANSLYTAFAMAAQKFGIIYDLQLLPYCPITSITGTWYESTGLNLNIPNDYEINYIRDSDDIIKGIILSVSESQFSGSIAQQIAIPQRTDFLAFNKKLSNELDMYRLVSSNFSSAFEFSPAKNGGISKFNYDCNYRPYNPYIHVNPDFAGLYGQDFDDPRGLVVSGDFSLPIMNDQFKQYEITHKNYESIFNRQIQNLDFNNKISNLESIFGISSGAMSAAASGAITGAAGGPIGSAVGAVTGAAISTAGGLLDLGIKKQVQQEQKQYAIDNYNLSIGNIKAMPMTLTKIGAYNANNKIYPMIEYYTATANEVESFKNKLKYDGMTMNVIGHLEDFINSTDDYDTLWRASLIRCEDIIEDTHLLNEINNELMKGVFI